MSKIAINAIFYQPKGGGIKEYIYNLLTNLAPICDNDEIIVYVLQDQLDYAKNELPNSFRYKAVPYRTGSLINTIKRSLFINNFWKKEEKTERWDLFHSPFFHAPKLKDTPILMTVHDMRFYRFPKTYTYLRYFFLQRAVKESSKIANHIITISDFTKSELIDAYNIPSDKITTIHEAINTERFSDIVNCDNIAQSSPYNQFSGKPFILTVGHLEPRKNYERLLEAFNKIKKNPDLKYLCLVIVGKKSHDYNRTLDLINNIPQAYYLDFVKHEELIWLYKNAKLFVFPSIYEGFGFPPLEAGALGTPSAVSNLSSMPEVCGDAVFYFDPYSVEDIANCISSVINDNSALEEKSNLVKKQIGTFSWARNARETYSLYNALIKKDNN